MSVASVVVSRLFWMTMSLHCAVRALSRPYITSRTQFRTGWPIPILGVWISTLVSIKSTNCLNPVDIFSKLGLLLIIVQHGLVNLANRWELHFWTFSKLYTKNCLGAKMSRMWWLKSNHFSVLQPCKILSMNFINPTIIAGFYNQVEHSRILQAVEFSISFCIIQHVPLNSTLQTRTNKKERALRTFRGHWRPKQTAPCNQIPTCARSALVEPFLFSCGGFKCSNNTVVLLWGHSGPQFCVQLLHWFNAWMYFCSCVSDISHTSFSTKFLQSLCRQSIAFDTFTSSVVQQFWKLNFYTAPILLEVADG